MSMIVKNKNDRELLGSLGSTVLFLIIVFIAAGIFVGFLFFYEKKNQEIVPLATHNESYILLSSPSDLNVTYFLQRVCTDRQSPLAALVKTSEPPGARTMPRSCPYSCT